MASSATKSLRQLLSKNSTVLKRGAESARQEVFGHVPILDGASTGSKTAKKAFTGSYLEKYYPVSINHYARKVSFGFGNEGMRLENMSLDPAMAALQIHTILVHYHSLNKLPFVSPFLIAMNSWFSNFPNHTDSINFKHPKIHDGWETEQEEYRRVKLTQRRRKGKGPPKKGAGARSGKKR